MTDYAHIKELMAQVLREECATVQSQRRELSRLFSDYLRYVDLESEQKIRQGRAERLTAILCGAIHDIPLWRLIAEYLATVGQARVCDVQECFAATNFKGTIYLIPLTNVR